MKPEVIYKREDGYTVYSYKGVDISFFRGIYAIDSWFRDNEYKTIEALIKAIKEEQSR